MEDDFDRIGEDSEEVLKPGAGGEFDTGDDFSQQPDQEGKWHEGLPDKNERLWATLCHLAAFSGFVGVPFGSILGPLVVWLVKRDGLPFVDANGKKALNFQISIAIYLVASSVFLCLGPFVLLIWLPLVLVDFIYTIIAAVKANGGEVPNYPISIKFFE